MENLLDPELVKILACPACDERPAVEYKPEESKLVCTACSREYPVIEGIPRLIVDEAANS
ncbi:MAG TPA: hypothetical protein DCR55_11340 [Lentisphaeria bacterium]|nr:hypothetical protein [Lentisphaeria bacterium]